MFSIAIVSMFSVYYPLDTGLKIERLMYNQFYQWSHSRKCLKKYGFMTKKMLSDVTIYGKSA